MGIDRLNMEVNDLRGLPLPNGHTVDGIHIGLGVTNGKGLTPLFLNYPDICPLSDKASLIIFSWMVLDTDNSPFFFLFCPNHTYQ